MRPTKRRLREELATAHRVIREMTASGAVSASEHILAQEQRRNARVVLDLWQEALETIVGPSVSGIYIGEYRDAGGGYEGLQAIARTALQDARLGEGKSA